MCAQKLIKINRDLPPSKIIFISSDSGSTTLFRDYEDGFGAYAASKAGLNQMLRHMAAELKRLGGDWERVCVLAMHPGEVQTLVVEGNHYD
jgi:NAD(P)-dependent dehydrogenase (short-subunit alcohol dehydrogenase family)